MKWIKQWIRNWLGITAEYKHIENKIVDLEKDCFAIIEKQLEFQESLTIEVKSAMEKVQEPLLLNGSNQL